MTHFRRILLLAALICSLILREEASAQFVQQGDKLLGTGALRWAAQGSSVSLSADGNTAIVGGADDNDSAGAVWVFTRSGGVWSQQGDKLVGTGAVGGAHQGSSVSLSADGNTAIVGGWMDNDLTGAVWVFTRSGGVWSQQGDKLVGTGAVGSAYQGCSVCLSADGNTAIVGGRCDSDFTGAVWVFTRSGGVWSQQGDKLVGTGAVGAAEQGSSVSLSADGNTVLVGGPFDNDLTGAVWVFTRSGGVWSQQGDKLVGTGALGWAAQGSSVSLSADGSTALVVSDVFNFGAFVFTRSGGVWSQQGDKLVGSGMTVRAVRFVSLSADGNTAIVGSSGAVWVFTRSGGVWSQQGDMLVGTGAVGSAYYGSWLNVSSSVALSADGNTAIVGGPGDNYSVGAVWVFTRSGGVWSQQGDKLVGTGSVGTGIYIGTSCLGHSVSLSADANTAVVGAPGDSGSTGAVWIFTRSGGVWSKQGDRLVGTGAAGSAYQGWSVSLSSDGNTAIVGGWGDNEYAGAVWVFTRSGGVWSQQGNKLVGTGAVGSAHQGSSVSLSADGNTAIVGGFYDNDYAGAVWVFTRSGGVWSQQGDKLVGRGAVGSAYQGWSVSLSADGNTALVGGGSDNGGVGAAWVFTRSGDVWSQQGNKLVGTGAVGSAYQGYSVSLSGDGNTAIVGGIDDNNSAGAVWVFTRSGGVWSQQGDKLVGTGAVGKASQGYSVSLSGDGNTAIVGGWRDNGGAGAVWVFTQRGGVWSQLGDKLAGTGAVGGAYQGRSVCLSADGKSVVVGGPNDNNPVGGAAWVFTRSATAVAEQSLEIPGQFSLEQNYPNPFNPVTVIQYTVGGARGKGLGTSNVRLVVYDLLGREVAVLVDERKPAGRYEFKFDGTGLASGVYVCRLAVGEDVATRKMALVR